MELWDTLNCMAKGGKGETRDQFLDRLLWGDSSSHAWTEKEELADLVAGKVPTWSFLARSPNDRTMRVAWKTMTKTMCLLHTYYTLSTSRKLETRRIHKHKQHANFSAKIESSEKVEARMEHNAMEPLVRGHSDENPDRDMTRVEWELGSNR